ncbi:MAG: prolipoprotein diacylglyceryl transferase [SAR324 cluster bacterium]|uniref:Phosphatidylglycerol--prolipoprotein diacylglyceryl transferase n=1 Tax=SAR324 cluster bacterium TaxID=2024889 RepID=A0A2A4T6W3_9DELT|nr:MAG: prolipoprotein diacylglyceryl transferase [SAR324 cluster bacterium]
MFDIITWNVSPDLLEWGVLRIRWYGLLFALSFVFGNYFLHWVFRREKKPIKYAESLLMHMIIGTVIGARLGHTLFYEPGFYLSHPLEILKVWKGGLASHGAGIGLFTAVYLYTRKTPGQSYLWVLDRLAVVVALSGALIRLGNFFNSEIIGKPTAGDWGIVFQRIDSLPRHPAQLYESVASFFVFLLLLFIYAQTNLQKKPGFIAGLFLVTIFSNRFFIEFFKENQVAFEVGMQFNMGQLLSIPMVLLGLFLIVRSLFFTRTTKSSGN